jgi:hypothetical protein
VLAQQPHVGDVVRVTFHAPTIGYLDYRVTRIDAQGIHGAVVQNTGRAGLPVVSIELVDIHGIYYIHSRCE